MNKQQSRKPKTWQHLTTIIATKEGQMCHPFDNYAKSINQIPEFKIDMNSALNSGKLS